MAKIFWFLAICTICVVLLLPGAVYSQEETGTTINASRGSIPEELMRPRREEAPRYALDMVIGPLGQGDAPTEVYIVACKVADDLVKGDTEGLETMPLALFESYLSILELIGPRNFRIGGGRFENDGSVSFLCRFIGRELAISGEMYLRQEEIPEEDDKPAQSLWKFEDLILEDAQSRKEENDKSEQRFDFTPYHRFY